MKDVALITLHGMGKTDTSYFSDLEKGLKNRLDTDWTRVSFQNVQYAPILQVPEEKLWNAMISNKNNDLDATRLRKFVLFGFADAASLEYSANNDINEEKNQYKGVYIKVQRTIQKALDHAFTDFDKDPSKPVVIIAHSLGCQVISNYLWDAEKNKNIFKADVTSDKKLLKFRKLKSLRNLITTGCNIPLFNAGLANRKCFKKPNDQFTWDNYYDPDDVLGWPLRQLGDTYNIVNDHHINSGGLFTSWNPLSHSGYWSDRDVVKPLAKILKSFF